MKKRAASWRERGPYEGQGGRIIAGREAPAVSMTPTMPACCGEIGAMGKQFRGILPDRAQRF